MSEQKKGLMPSLRFPEFREAGEWEEKPLSKCCHMQAGKFVRANDIHGKPATDRYPCYGGNGLRGYTKTFTHSGTYPLIGRQGAQCGNINLASGEFHATEHAVVAKANKGVDTIWLFYKLIWMNLNQYATGQAQPGLSVENLEKLTVQLPISEKEQQKIASCLSSLDALIAAQADKLDALKTHKQGLMQRLFPREGETVPRVRFPEFREAQEWTETKLGQNLSRKPEYGINAPAVAYDDNLPTYLRITDISDDGQIRQDQKVSVPKSVTDENYLEEGDIVLARTGASVGKAYKYRTKDGRLVFAGFLIRVRPNETRLDSEFLFQFLSTERYWRWVSFASARSGQPGINGNEYASLPIQLPPTLNEQQEVASCLSSLDALIAAQADKLDTLKTHKKGLMQQLFPSQEADLG